jgi:hypothetical protein
MTAIIGTTEQIVDLFFPIQQDEHCKGWRWHLFVQDDHKRMANVMAELRQIHAERCERLAALHAEIQTLEDAQ